jgi:hypothetical protein
VSTPFLLAYASAVIRALLERERIEIIGSEEQVAKDLAAFLAGRKGHSLISSTSLALLGSEHVAELYADDEEIKDIVDALGSG